MPTIPPSKVPKILDELERLKTSPFAKKTARLTPAYASPRRRYSSVRGITLWAFELPCDLDILLNDSPVATDRRWDDLFYHQGSWSALPNRVEKRMIESCELSFRKWREDLLVDGPKKQLDRVIVNNAARSCPPGSAVVWKDKEFIGAVDCHGAYTKPYEWTSKYLSEAEFIEELKAILVVIRSSNGG